MGQRRLELRIRLPQVSLPEENDHRKFPQRFRSFWSTGLLLGYFESIKQLSRSID